MQRNNLGDITDRRHFDNLALIDLHGGRERRLTFEQIHNMADAVAQRLTEEGLDRGASVAILSANRAEYVIAYLGIMRAGFVAVPINIKQPDDVVTLMLSDCEAAFAFVDTDNRARLPAALPFVDFDVDDGPAAWRNITPAFFRTVEMDEDEIAQILYTSGSTGRPKGVMLTHSGQLWALDIRAAPVASTERYIVAQPLFHMNGIFGIKTAFAAGASTVLLPRFTAESYVEAIVRYQVAEIIAIPTMFARILRNPTFDDVDFSHVTKMMLGSSPITDGLVARLRDRFPNALFANGYGTTEGGPAIFGPHPDGRAAPGTSVGYPLFPEQVKLVDGPSDDEGVLAMKNPAVMAGYKNLEDKTAAVLKDGWYISGDVMRRDEDGFYYFAGRSDDMFVCSGENIYPDDVALMLERHPQVRQAAVVPMPDEERGAVPVAFLVAADSAAPSFSDIRTFALANGPGYQHPRRVAFVPDLPVTVTNKIDRRALIAKAAELERSGTWTA
ncbi:MAG: class I adenylate-forming enzyme family protein [Pseudomonadota bacterium]|nr:class I adenylate-forming enzyme family protein [Pseudomonadota bacterium]